jgi:hypothetical protein
MIKVKGSGGSAEMKTAAVDYTASVKTATVTGLDFTPTAFVFKCLYGSTYYGASAVAGWHTSNNAGSNPYIAEIDADQAITKIWSNRLTGDTPYAEIDVTNIAQGGFKFTITSTYLAVKQVTAYGV